MPPSVATTNKRGDTLSLGELAQDRQSAAVPSLPGKPGESDAKALGGGSVQSRKTRRPRNRGKSQSGEQAQLRERTLEPTPETGGKGKGKSGGKGSKGKGAGKVADERDRGGRPTANPTNPTNVGSEGRRGRGRPCTTVPPAPWHNRAGSVACKRHEGTLHWGWAEPLSDGSTMEETPRSTVEDGQRTVQGQLLEQVTRIEAQVEFFPPVRKDAVVFSKKNWADLSNDVFVEEDFAVDEVFMEECVELIYRRDGKVPPAIWQGGKNTVAEEPVAEEPVVADALDREFEFICGRLGKLSFEDNLGTLGEDKWGNLGTLRREHGYEAVFVHARQEEQKAEPTAVFNSVKKAMVSQLAKSGYVGAMGRFGVAKGSLSVYFLLVHRSDLSDLFVQQVVRECMHEVNEPELKDFFGNCKVATVAVDCSCSNFDQDIIFGGIKCPQFMRAKEAERSRLKRKRKLESPAKKEVGTSPKRRNVDSAVQNAVAETFFSEAAAKMTAAAEEAAEKAAGFIMTITAAAVQRLETTAAKSQDDGPHCLTRDETEAILADKQEQLDQASQLLEVAESRLRSEAPC